jgi:glutamine synthetase
MARTIILPACLRYQGEVACAVNSAKSAGVKTEAQLDLLKSLASLTTDLQKSIAALDKALAHHGDADAYAHAKHMRDVVLPAMNEVRQNADLLENLVADDLWPLPKYREMLFVK